MSKTTILSYQNAHTWAKDLVAQMTLEEKCDYLGGTRGFYTKAIPRLNLPSVLFSDATAGVVVRDRFLEHTYKNPLQKSTAFPAPIQLSATWNTELTQAFATSIGEQCNANGIGVLLGPGFNLYRISQCGRNFEYFGEDPHLISEHVRTYVEAVQNTGTAATLKHFVANNTDYFRRKSNSVLNERTLHEIYMPAFKAGIEAGALAVMTAYNLVNGEWAGQSDYVINQLLRKTLGFQWMVMSDWWSIFDGQKTVNSGQDIEMPAVEATANTLALVKNGTLTEAAINRMVCSVLSALKAIDAFDKKPTPMTDADFKRHEQVAFQTALEGTVLLKNNGTLPLKPSTKILGLGEPIAEKIIGGGSSYVKGYDQITQLEAFTQTFEHFEYEPAPTDEQIAAAECIILSVATKDCESYDRPFALISGDEAFVQRVLNLNSNVIILANTGSGLRMTDWTNKAAAIVYAWYNGQNGNLALADLLVGKANPSGKLPFTIEKEFSDSPGANYIPEGEVLYCGENDAWEANRKPYDVNYDEGIFVGYRWYEHKKIQPLFPFGFGLSYTTFDYKDLSLNKQEKSASDDIALSFTLTNTGKLAGKEIAQVYIKNAPASEPRPLKELKGFTKVGLQPGEAKTLKLTLNAKDFAFYSSTKNDWVVEPGEFTICVGSASNAIQLEAPLKIR